MTELCNTASCTYCGQPLSDFARRVHALDAHAAWSLASKEHAPDCWWIVSRAGHLRGAASNPRKAASVALLRAMDREPRSYLANVLRAVHANAARGELDDLLREAFGPSTAAKMRPRAWRDLRDRFAGRLYMGPESERWATDIELRQWLSAESSAESPFESGERIAGVALFAHLMAFVAGEI